MTTKKPIVHCAGLFHAGNPFTQCANCQRRTAPIPARGEWIAPPEFDVDCPERLEPPVPSGKI